MLATLKPSALALPTPLLEDASRRGRAATGQTRELFPRYTGQMFDAITPAVSAADLTHRLPARRDARAARLVEQNALDPTLPGLHGVIDKLLAATFAAAPADPYEAEIAARRPARGRRAPDDARGERRRHVAGARDRDGEAAAPVPPRCRRRARQPAAAHAALLAADIKRFLDRPAAAGDAHAPPDAPPGRADRRAGDGLAPLRRAGVLALG